MRNAVSYYLFLQLPASLVDGMVLRWRTSLRFPRFPVSQRRCVVIQCVLTLCGCVPRAYPCLPNLLFHLPDPARRRTTVGQIPHSRVFILCAVWVCRYHQLPMATPDPLCPAPCVPRTTAFVIPTSLLASTSRFVSLPPPPLSPPSLSVCSHGMV